MTRAISVFPLWVLISLTGKAFFLTLQHCSATELAELSLLNSGFPRRLVQFRWLSSPVPLHSSSLSWLVRITATHLENRTIRKYLVANLCCGKTFTPEQCLQEEDSDLLGYNTASIVKYSSRRFEGVWCLYLHYAEGRNTSETSITTWRHMPKNLNLSLFRSGNKFWGIHWHALRHFQALGPY
jgi:hypothetical protein